ncbi:MAG: iron-sulfur cluster assembly scaffold protein [Terriglobia bacterium]|jgi:nitrogen fixation NifU-like protein
MYSERVLDHFHNPRHAGELDDATAVIEVTNPACGDVMKLWVVVRDGQVADARFKVEGCVPAVACGSWLTEWILGKPLADLSSLLPQQIAAALDGLPQASQHAAVLASDALKRLLEELV